MKGKINNKLGEINISEDVIANYAGTVAVECFGIVGMAMVSVKNGLVSLLKKEALQKGIEVEVKNNEIRLAFHVIVSYGVSIQAVCNNLIDSVKYKVEEFTGMKVSRIDVFVEGVKPID